MNYRLPLAAAAVVVCAGSATLWMFPHGKRPKAATQALNAGQLKTQKTSASAKEILAKIPMWFEALPDGRFAAKSMGRTVLLDRQAAVWKMRGGSSIRMEFQNGNKAAAKHGVDRLAARFDRYQGNDKSKWQSNIPAYQKVSYDGIYPGVNLVFYGKGSRMEHDFIVAPGADPKQIRLAFAGASKIHLDGQGNLKLESSSRDGLALTKPVAYQTDGNGERKEIAARFTTAADQTVGFELGEYDSNRPLVIDPIIQYGGYYGASGDDEFVSVAVDLRSDSVWVAGSSDSIDIQTNNNGTLNGSTAGGSRDVLVAQFIQAGSGQLTLNYSSTVGGTSDDVAAGIGVAPNGRVYVVGTTDSANFPNVNSYNTVFQGESDAFVIAIDPTYTDTSALIYSTFLGGTAQDHATAMTIDQNSFLYVTGYTTSLDFPTSSGAILAGNRGGYDPWVVKMDVTAGTNGLLYSTTYGGSLTDQATGVAVDSKGIIYMTGWTFSTDFPASGTVPFYFAPGQGDSWLVAIDPTQTGDAGIVFCTYFGGSGFDQATTMAFAPNGHLFIGGFTTSDDFPIVGNAPQIRNNGNADMFLTEWDFTQTPSQWIVFSTFLGGSDDEIPYNMSIDPQNRVTMIGYTSPSSATEVAAIPFPTTANALQTASAGLQEGIITRFDTSKPTAQILTFSSYFGGPQNDLLFGVAADPRGCFIFAAGKTSSPNLALSSQAQAFSVGPDAYLMNIDTCNNPAPSTTTTDLARRK